MMVSVDPARPGGFRSGRSAMCGGFPWRFIAFFVHISRKDDEWDSLVSKSEFYVKFGVDIGRCSFHFDGNRKISDFAVI